MILRIIFGRNLGERDYFSEGIISKLKDPNEDFKNYREAFGFGGCSSFRAKEASQRPIVPTTKLAVP